MSTVAPARAVGPPDAERPRLLDQVRRALRARRYSPRTEEAYVGWVRRFVRFHGMRHPAELGAAEVGAFLTWLAADQRVAAGTQALCAVLFLYRTVLRRPGSAARASRAGAGPPSCRSRARGWPRPASGPDGAEVLQGVR